MFWVDLAGFGLTRIQSGIFILRVGIGFVIVLHILHWARLGSTAKSALIIDTPGQDLVIMCQGGAMHASNSDLNNSDILCGKEWVQSGTSDINNFSSTRMLCTKSKLTSAAFPEDKHVKSLSERVVKGWEDFGGFRWLGRFGWLWSLGFWSGFGFR
jgi:hypothetical protein